MLKLTSFQHTYNKPTIVIWPRLGAQFKYQFHTIMTCDDKHFCLILLFFMSLKKEFSSIFWPLTFFPTIGRV